MGIEFREASLLIGPKCTATVQKGMTFNIHIGFSDIKNDASSDDGGKKYALFLGDTVLINEVRIKLNHDIIHVLFLNVHQVISTMVTLLIIQSGPATPLAPTKKKLKSIGIYLKDEDEEEEDEKENEPEPTDVVGRNRRTAILESKLRVNDFYHY